MDNQAQNEDQIEASTDKPKELKEALEKKEISDKNTKEPDNKSAGDGNKNSKCKVCELSFSSVQDLDKHRKIHDMEKMKAFSKDAKIIVGSKVVLDLKLRKILPGTPGISPNSKVISKLPSPVIDLKAKSPPINDGKSVIINGKTFKIIKSPDKVKSTTTPAITIGKPCDIQLVHQGGSNEKPKFQTIIKARNKEEVKTLDKKAKEAKAMRKPSVQVKSSSPTSFNKPFVKKKSYSSVRLSDIPSGSVIKPSITEIMRRCSVGPDSKSLDSTPLSSKKTFNLPASKPIVISNLPKQLHTVNFVDAYKKSNKRIVLPKVTSQSDDSPHFRKVVVTKMEIPFHPSVHTAHVPTKSVKKKLYDFAPKSDRKSFNPNIEELLARIRNNGPRTTSSPEQEVDTKDTGIDFNLSSEEHSSESSNDGSCKNNNDGENSEKNLQNDPNIIKTLPNTQIQVVQSTKRVVKKTNKNSKSKSLLKAIQYPKDKDSQSQQSPHQPPAQPPPIKAIYYPPGYNSSVTGPAPIIPPLQKPDVYQKIYEKEKIPSPNLKPIKAIFYPRGYEDNNRNSTTNCVSSNTSPKSLIKPDAFQYPRKFEEKRTNTPKFVRTIGHFSSLSCNINMADEYSSAQAKESSDPSKNIINITGSNKMPEFEDNTTNSELENQQKAKFKQTMQDLNEQFVGKKIKMIKFQADDLPAEKVDLKNISILKPKRETSIGGKKVKAILVRKNGKTFVVQKKGTFASRWSNNFIKYQKKKKKELAEKISRTYESEDENSVHDILLANLSDRLLAVQQSARQTNVEGVSDNTEKLIENSLETKLIIKEEKTSPQQKFPSEVCPDRLPDNQEHDENILDHEQTESIATFICHICRKGFREQEHFDNHMAEHVNEEMTFSCDTCNLKFRTESLLTGHMKLHRKEEAIKCSDCPAIFRYPRELRFHRNMHSNDHKCSTCGMIFNTMAEVKNHMLAQHQHTEISKCPTCDAVCGTLYELRKHVKIHTQEIANVTIKQEKDDSYEENLKYVAAPIPKSPRNQFGKQFIKRYTCKECERVFTSPEIFKLHMNQHVKTGDDHKCELCEKRFLTDREFAVHVRTHKEIIDFMCPYCPKVCVNIEKLSRHISDHRREQHRCERCGDTFQTNVELSRHYREHRFNDYKPKNKASVENMVKDMNDIPMQPTFKCKICLKTFIAKKGLVKHIMAHKTKEMEVRTNSPLVFTPSSSYVPVKRPTSFACEYCGRTFTEKKAHGSHIRIHVDGTFICKICSIPFRLEYNLQSHMKNHPTCKFCGKGFKLNVNVKQHEKECEVLGKHKSAKKIDSPVKPIIKLEPLSDSEMDIESDTSIKSEDDKDFIGFNQEEVTKEKENVTEMKQKLLKISKRSNQLDEIQTDILQRLNSRPYIRKRKMAGESLLKKKQPKLESEKGQKGSMKTIEMEPGPSQELLMTDRLLKCMLCDLVFVKQDNLSRHFTSHLVGCEVKLQKIK